MEWKRKLVVAIVLAASILPSMAEDELIRFGDFDSWITRSLQESALVGGKKVTLYEVGPAGSFDGARAFTNMGGCPWGNSNVYAKVSGIVKTNLSVFPDTHGDGKCAKLCTEYVKCKALGVINITVLGTGSMFLGYVKEPITSVSNPNGNVSYGVPFTRRPKALKFDYKYYNPGDKNRIKESGMGKAQAIPGKDMAECTCLLQKRWEDAQGKIHSLRVGTLRTRFSQNTEGWVEDKELPIHYGDISKADFFRDWMGMVNGDRAYHAVNSKGKIVPIIEEGWADADETPTHVIVSFDSSYGGAYVGTVGNTLWIDNVRFVY